MNSFGLLAQTDEEMIQAVVTIVFVLVAMAIGLAIQVFICWVAYKTAAAIPPQYREVEPGLVWLLLIPCFAVVWNFFVYPKISNGYKRFFQDAGVYHNGDCAAGIALWYCLCVIFSMIPYLGVIPGFASLILLILMLVKFWDYKGQAERGYVPTYAAPAPIAKKSDPTNPYA